MSMCKTCGARLIKSGPSAKQYKCPRAHSTPARVSMMTEAEWNTIADEIEEQENPFISCMKQGKDQ